MQILVFAPAETVIVDAQSGKMSLINVFEAVRIEAIPVFVPKLSVLSIVSFDDSDSGEPLSLKLKSGMRVISESVLILQGTGVRYIKNVTTFSNIVITGIEDIVVTLECGISVIASYRIKVIANIAPKDGMGSMNNTMMENDIGGTKVTIN